MMKVTWLNFKGRPPITQTIVTTLSQSDVVVVQARIEPTKTAPNFVSDIELKKAADFVDDLDGYRYLAGRSILRQLLSPLANETPDHLCFLYGPEGKPELMNHPHIFFNLAHSQEFLLLAFALNNEVGVDVETFAPVPEWSDLIKNWAPQDRRWIDGAPQAEQKFLLGWAAREAVLKSFGHGVAHLDQLSGTEFCDANGEFRPLIGTPWGAVSLHTKTGLRGELIALSVVLGRN